MGMMLLVEDVTHLPQMHLPPRFFLLQLLSLELPHP
jgi:hypothetical protein